MLKFSTAILFSIQISRISAQDETNAFEACALIPDSSSRIFCNQLHQWDKLAQSNKAVASNKDNKRPEFNGKAERKEYRQLTNEERQKVNSAFWVLKHDGDYDKLIREYSENPELSATAHAGPGFLPYHREFLLRLELMLRKIDPDISLPYIDLTLDSNLDDPKQSVLFSNDLMGDTNGPSGLVADGPFKDWPTTTGGQGIERAVGVEGKGYPMTDVEVKELLSGNLTNWLGYSVPQQGCFIDDSLNTIEFLSGDNNIFIGGTMKNIRTQFDDPLAIMSMAFIDMLWEQFRRTKQSPEQREADYPSDEVLCESHHHFLSHVMYPFDKMTVKDGLSNSYTEQFYTYAPRPTCSEQNIHGCRSRFLFCDFSYGEPRCSSKLKPQSSCDNYHRGEAACFQTECTNKICSQSDQVSFSAPALGAHAPTEVAPATSRVTTDVPVEEITTDVPVVEITTDVPVVEITTMIAADVPPPTTEAPQRPQAAVAADVPAPTSPPQVGFAAGTSTQVRETCYNELKCCETWSLAGYCSGANNYMFKYCKASCGVCKPTTYFLNDDCNDRHANCPTFAKNGQCRTYGFWMEENCRKSCKKCLATRLEECELGRSQPGSLPNLPIQTLPRSPTNAGNVWWSNGQRVQPTFLQQNWFQPAPNAFGR